MKTTKMKAVTITMPTDLDAEAAEHARRLGISKSELILRGLATVLPTESTEPSDDLWRDMVGFGRKGLSV